MGSDYFQNKARRSYWVVHVEAWRKSGLTRTEYCREHGLAKSTFDRWQTALEGAKSLQLKPSPSRRTRRQPLARARRSLAVEAFWAMHVEALNWSNVTAAEYAKAHRIDATCLRLWRRRFDADPLEVDWRARLHPSARPRISSNLSSAAKQTSTETRLTDASPGDPPPDRRANRRRFSDAEKLAIVCESEELGATVAAVCRRHGIVTSMLFRWRVQFRVGQHERAELVTVRLHDGRSRGKRRASAVPLVMQDLLPVPEGMQAIDLADGRRVFAPIGSDPDAVRRHVAEQEAAT